MKTLSNIIISAVLFLGLHSQTFATDEQEDIGLAQQARAGFSRLPIELQEYIFYFLDQKDFHRASLVCQSWRDVARMSEGERSLDLSNRKLNQKDCEALLQVPFTSLVLQNCQLGEQEAHILSRSPRIKSLILRGNNLRDMGVEALASGKLTASRSVHLALTSAYKALTSLGFWGNSIDVERTEALTSGNLTSLTSLDLKRNSIGAGGAKALATGNLVALTTLNLYGNNIGDEGAKALASGNLIALTELDLQLTYIGNEGAKALALGNLTALTSLYLLGNSIGDEGAQVLASGNLGVLTSLNLAINSIGDAGAEVLASGNLTALTSLNLWNNNITGEGKKAFKGLKFAPTW